MDVNEKMLKTERKLLTIGDSMGVTLPKKWIDFQKWMGNDLDSLILIALGDVVILVPPDKEEKAERVVRDLEKIQKDMISDSIRRGIQGSKKEEKERE